MKLTYAGNHHPEFVQPIDDLCTAVARNAWAGTGCAEDGPDQHILCSLHAAFQPLFTACRKRLIGWHAAARGMTVSARAWDSWQPIRASTTFSIPGGRHLLSAGPVA
jgi:hypothetical protein